MSWGRFSRHRKPRFPRKTRRARWARRPHDGRIARRAFDRPVWVRAWTEPPGSAAPALGTQPDRDTDEVSGANPARNSAGSCCFARGMRVCQEKRPPDRMRVCQEKRPLDTRCSRISSERVLQMGRLPWANVPYSLSHPCDPLKPHHFTLMVTTAVLDPDL